MGAVIIGSGKALPNLSVSNTELEDLVITNDEWIRTRTGIESRHISVSESTSDLAFLAAKRALGLEDGEAETSWVSKTVDPATIDLLIFATITSDSIVPSSASILKAKLGLENAIAFDINAACTGFIYALSIAESMMCASLPNTVGSQGRNHVKRALVVCSERLSRLTDWQDRNTCILFGDGAGAALLEWDDEKPGIISTYMVNADDTGFALSCPHSYTTALPFCDEGVICDHEAYSAHHESHPDPKQVDYTYINTLGLPRDPSEVSVDEMMLITDRVSNGTPRQTLYMDGQKIFKFAGKAMSSAIEETLKRSGLSFDDIKAIIPHQANERIISFAARRLELPLEMFQLSIAEVGNTSSASVPMALTDALCNGKIEPGDKAIMVAFGGGLTCGAVLFEL